MSDNDPNKVLNIKRLVVEMGQMTLNIQRMELRQMELDEEGKKIVENVAASNKRITELQTQIKLMEN